MVQQNAIKVFEEKKICTVWDSDQEEWYFSIINVIAILTENDNPRRFWSDLKHKLTKEGSQLYDKIVQLKLPTEDGKIRLTDVTVTQNFIEIRQDLTDEWKRHGLQEGEHFATLTDIIYQSWAGKTAKEYKQFKGLKKENLRDNMTNKELVLNMLAELSTKEISEAQNPATFDDHMDIARRGGNVAKEARLRLEQETGKPVVTPLNAKHILGLDNGKPHFLKRKRRNSMAQKKRTILSALDSHPAPYQSDGTTRLELRTLRLVQSPKQHKQTLGAFRHIQTQPAYRFQIIHG